MFDYETSKHAHFDSACRAFSLSHNLEDVAAAVGMRPQMLRNKLNPAQPHRLTCDELLAITDYTEDARLLDGMLGQINCLPSVLVNNATEGNMQLCTLSATASVGAIAGEAVSTGHMTAARRTQILDRARDAIRSLSVLVYAVESRIQSAPVLAAAVVLVVKADTERRDLVSRETTVKATDKTMVLGTATLMAGAIQQVSAGDYSQAVKGNRLVSIEGNDETDIAGKQSTKVAGAVDVDVGGTLTEKIAALRKSVAAGGQQIMGPTVHIGSESVNTLTMMLDTIDLLAELAQQCASHSHPSVGTPTNAGAFTQTAEKAGQTRSKYQKIIA